MNKTKIEWADYTWNPITGCSNSCSYCYARMIARRFKWPFKPTVHRKRLSEPQSRKKPALIFACSMGDMFCPEIERIERLNVAAAISAAKQHRFVVLTKLPERIDINFPNNTIVGTSIEKPIFLHRLNTLRKHKLLYSGQRLACFEPLLEPMKPDLERIDWVIIGGLTGREHTFQPPHQWVDTIIGQARKFNIPVFVKPNAGYHTYTEEFPLFSRTGRGVQ